MKQYLSNFLTWLILFIVITELSRLAYNHLYFPLMIPDTGEMNYGNILLDFIMLGFQFLLFGAAGFAIAWKLNSKLISVAVAMSLGLFWLAVEIATAIPWFQLIPSHPTMYDHVLAFTGTIIPASSAAIGSYWYCYSTKTGDSQHPT